MNPIKGLHAVIMAGGVGSRFWPLSRNHKPKQFLDVLGTGQSLIQTTFQRLARTVDPKNIWIVSHQDYRDLVLQQLPDVVPEQILLEPERKNTAACILYATKYIEQAEKDAIVLIAPSDHLILNEAVFDQDVSESVAFLYSRPEALLTFGIKASRPDTGYGYIKFNPDSNLENNVHPVAKFVEKPDHNTALSYLAGGDYVWNSGMFLWANKTIDAALLKYQPELYQLFEGYQPGMSVSQIYRDAPSISIDYAVMEKTDKAFVKTVDFGWSDLGTWTSLYELMNQDDQSNALHAPLSVINQVHSCMVRNEESKLIALHGVENLIIINTADALLICDKNQEQAIKSLVGHIEIKYGKKYL